MPICILRGEIAGIKMMMTMIENSLYSIAMVNLMRHDLNTFSLGTKGMEEPVMC